MSSRTIHDPCELVPKSRRVIYGTVAGILATTLTHPLDLIKDHQQLSPTQRTPTGTARAVVRSGGYSALYKGLSAALMRQATYTTARLTCYNILYDRFKRKYNQVPTTCDKVRLGIYSGVIGALAGNPAEVALVRLMAPTPRTQCCQCCWDCMNPYVCEQRAPHPKPYKGLVNALTRIIDEEGRQGLWRGVSLTVARSMLLSAAQIGTYSQAREICKGVRMSDGYMMHIFSSVVSSFFTSVLTLPVDLIKTRYQVCRGKDCMTQRQIINDILDCKGTRHLWTGFAPHFLRMVVHTFITFSVLEEVSKATIRRDAEEKNEERQGKSWWSWLRRYF